MFPMLWSFSISKQKNRTINSLILKVFIIFSNPRIMVSFTAPILYMCLYMCQVCDYGVYVFMMVVDGGCDIYKTGIIYFNSNLNKNTILMLT